MDIIFNELSCNILAQTAGEAGLWLDEFFDTADTFSKRTGKKINIRTTILLKDVLVAPNYPFVLWLNTIKSRDYLRRIVSQLTHKPLIDKYPYYYYNGNTCEGFGIADQLKLHAISYPSSKWTYITKIEKEFFDESENVKKVEIKIYNLRKLEDIDRVFPLRIFEHHNKHDNHRPNLNDGESTLQYDIPNEMKKVQRLLETAFGRRKLFNWDESKKMYIEFQKHHENKWHGYHITDVSRVPNKIQKKITEFIALI